MHALTPKQRPYYHTSRTRRKIVVYNFNYLCWRWNALHLSNAHWVSYWMDYGALQVDIIIIIIIITHSRPFRLLSRQYALWQDATQATHDMGPIWDPYGLPIRIRAAEKNLGSMMVTWRMPISTDCHTVSGNDTTQPTWNPYSLSMNKAHEWCQSPSFFCQTPHF